MFGSFSSPFAGPCQYRSADKESRSNVLVMKIMTIMTRYVLIWPQCHYQCLISHGRPLLWEGLVYGPKEQKSIKARIKAFLNETFAKGGSFFPYPLQPVSSGTSLKIQYSVSNRSCPRVAAHSIECLHCVY